MKRWFGLLFLLHSFAAPCIAQDLSGVWQGEANNMPRRDICPVSMAIDKDKGGPLTGRLYQEFEYGKYFVLFHLTGTLQAKTLVIKLDGVLQDRHPDIPDFRWDAEPISLTYDEREEKLVGRNLSGKNTRGGAYTFTLFRIKLKSSPAVPAAALTTLRVSGHDVHWYADPALKHLVARSNTFSTRLQKTTTFYLTQGFYASRQGRAVPVTVRVKPHLPLPVPVASRATPVADAAPVVLPTVRFFLGTATLLPTSSPALAGLAADLKLKPMAQVRVAGHTDRVGEADKNQALSERRAAAVKQFLVKAGIAAERISTVGYGDSRPITPSPDVRNRRVEVEVLK